MKKADEEGIDTGRDSNVLATEQAFVRSHTRLIIGFRESLKNLEISTNIALRSYAK